MKAPLAILDSHANTNKSYCQAIIDLPTEEGWLGRTSRACC